MNEFPDLDKKREQVRGRRESQQKKREQVRRERLTENKREDKGREEKKRGGGSTAKGRRGMNFNRKEKDKEKERRGYKMSQMRREEKNGELVGKIKSRGARILSL